MTEQEFKTAILAWDINLTKEQEKKLKEYAEFLLEYNRHTNLTAIKTLDGVYLKHFYDSLTLANYIDIKSPKKILDVGTGAGFPGLVLKIVFPNIQLTLLDSNHKKTDFLKQCCEKLNINDVQIENCRAEEFVKQNREQFDYVVSRAVASLRILCELNIPALKVGGFFLAMKGTVEKEVKESEKTIEKLESEIQKIWTFELPLNAGKRSIIQIKKKKKTDQIYPRAYDKIVKKPIA